MPVANALLPQEVIRRKRDGHILTAAEIQFMVDAMVTGAASDSQLAAFAMAVLLRGMDHEETVLLTRAMAGSGQIMDWTGASLNGPVLDKHSTGGIGDKPSLVLAPMLAACGAYVPMVSGRGLGHTGGTLDKLEAIPGYDAHPSATVLWRGIRRAGCAIVGAGPEIAPADRRLYAIRDVTATVECAPLIISSILAKKLAAGLDGLVLDVKFGTGSLVGDAVAAKALAEELATVANAAGVVTRALVTDMNQVLGRTAGNRLEVLEARDYLQGSARDRRLHELVLELGSEALVLGRLASDLADARRQLLAALDSGTAAERFARMVVELGGPPDLLERADTLMAPAPVVRAVRARSAGRLVAMDARRAGLAVVALGGGRIRPDDRIDHRVGLSEVVSLGETVDAHRPLCLVHAADETSARAAEAALLAAVRIDSGPAPGGDDDTQTRRGAVTASPVDAVSNSATAAGQRADELVLARFGRGSSDSGSC